MGVKQFAKTAVDVMSRNGPYILTGICLGGNFAGTVLAVKATPKALADIRIAEEKKGSPLTPQEIVKAAGKNYIIPLSIIAVSDICGILGIRKSERGKAAIASAAIMTENFGREYQQKVIEHVGEEEEQKIRTELYRDKVKEAIVKDPPKADLLPQCGTGKQLFYYVRHHQWFRSSVEEIRTRVNDFNQILNASFNGLTEQEFMDELGLCPDSSAEAFIWTPSRGLVQIYFIYPDTQENRAYISPWGEVAIGLEFEPFHEPFIDPNAVKKSKTI